MNGSAQGQYAFVWLGATKDAWVGCADPNCQNGNINHGLDYSLNVSDVLNSSGLMRIYVEFYIPQLPQGTQIIEAYINLYENSQQTPGTATLSVTSVNSEWNPRTINHHNQPMPLGAISNDAYIGSFQGVNQWRGTVLPDNLKNVVQSHINTPDQNHGFIISIQGGNSNVLRSFQSDNAPGRTETDMEFSPRLLLKVKLPGGEGHLDASTIGLPELPKDTDLNETLNGPVILMVQLAGGSDWPQSWRLATN